MEKINDRMFFRFKHRPKYVCNIYGTVKSVKAMVLMPNWLRWYDENIAKYVRVITYFFSSHKWKELLLAKNSKRVYNYSPYLTVTNDLRC